MEKVGQRNTHKSGLKFKITSNMNCNKLHFRQKRILKYRKLLTARSLVKRKDYSGAVDTLFEDLKFGWIVTVNDLNSAVLQAKWTKMLD